MSMLYRTCYEDVCNLDIRARVDVIKFQQQGSNTSDTICQLEGLISELQQDNKRYAALQGSQCQGPRHPHCKSIVRQKGQAEGAKAQHHNEACKHRHAETVDCSVCPDCDDDNLSGVTDQYSSRRTHEGYVQYKIKRRYCRCQKQVSAKVPGVMYRRFI